jgi:hypothetical protein
MDYLIVLCIPISDKNNYLIISSFNIFVFLFLDSRLRGNDRDGRMNDKRNLSSVIASEAK